MRTSITLLLSLFCLSLSADKVVVDSLENVDLLISDKLTKENHCYGEEFYVHNKNIVPILFTIHIKEIINGKNSLIKHPMTIQPYNMVSVGTVEQIDQSQEGNWSWEWTIKML